MKKLIFLLLLTGCATGPNIPLDRIDYGRPISEQEAIEAAYRIERRYALDPDAIQIRMDRPPSKGYVYNKIDGETSAGYRFCYSVNGKNVYGAYTGFERKFIVINDGYVNYIKSGSAVHDLCNW